MATQENISKRTGSAPVKNEVRKAKVIANYGDVGLTESKYFDLLSRFVVVMFEPESSMIPTRENVSKLFAIVARPRNLWISVDGGIQANEANQLRSDNTGNSNRGVPSAYSINNIPKINRPYALGETITIKRLQNPYYFSDSFFSSSFDSSYFSVSACRYDETYLTRDPAGIQSISANAGKWDVYRVFPLYAGAGNVRGAAINGTAYSGGSIATFLNAKLSFPTKSNSGTPIQANLEAYDPNYHFGIGVTKYHYEVFGRSFTTQLSAYDSFIAGTYSAGSYNNKYLWNATSPLQSSIVLMNSCFYEDLNTDGKNRVPSSECLPLIITQPNTFPIPRTRQAGSLLFNPTYTTVVSP
jgi:hypothetical protein